MLLNINDDSEFTGPMDPDLDRELDALRPDQFAILSSGDEVYVQCYLNEDGLFDLEYREGSFDAHFRVESAERSMVVAGFSAFLAGAFDSWKATVDWIKVDFDEDFQGDDLG